MTAPFGKGVLVPAREHDLETVRAAAYVLSDRAWVLLEEAPDGVLVRLTAKTAGDTFSLLEAELRSELANQRLRLRLSRENAAAERRLVQEAIVPPAS
jgi:hypothetical protein